MNKICFVNDGRGGSKCQRIQLKFAVVVEGIQEINLGGEQLDPKKVLFLGHPRKDQLPVHIMQENTSFPD